MLTKLQKSLTNGALTKHVHEKVGKRPREICNEEPLVHLLATVPGVSLKLARVLTKSYPSTSAIFEAGVDEISLLKSENGRRVGSCVAAKIKNYFK